MSVYVEGHIDRYLPVVRGGERKAYGISYFLSFEVAPSLRKKIRDSLWCQVRWAANKSRLVRCAVNLSTKNDTGGEGFV